MKNLVKRLGLGMRTMKTIAAVAVILLLAWLCRYSSPFYACIAAVLTVRETPKKSVLYGKERMVGTLYAGAIALFLLWIYSFLSITWVRYLLIPVAILLGFMLCNVTGQSKSCAICGIVILAIMLNHPESDTYLYAVSRIVETLIGIVVATVINFIPARKASPPKAEGQNETAGDSACRS